MVSSWQVRLALTSTFLVFMQFHVYVCFGCLEEERIALLQLKASINYNSDGEPTKYWDPETDCCNWEGVKCNTTTERVASISLNQKAVEWEMNASLFLPFEDLVHLDLSGNLISNWVPGQGLERLSVLSKLRVLNLNENYFDNSILLSVGALSSIKTLSLSGNNLLGTINCKGFRNMSNLVELDLGNNVINNMKGLDGVKHLQALYLDQSSIRDGFLRDVKELSSLRVLSMQGLGLNGSLPDQGWCELFNLEQLNLSENNLEGMLPLCLGNLTRMQFLILSNNKLSGDIASSSLVHIKALKYLSLSNNNFEVPNSFVSFYNHSNLKVLSCDNNTLSVQIEIHTSIPSFQLLVFSFSNIRSNSILPTKLPHFLQYQYDLRAVDLSHNGHAATFPNWLMENNTHLEKLILKNNSFSGPFQLPSRPNPYTVTIVISQNSLEGQLPTKIGLIFPNLEVLSISRNLMGGRLPISLGLLHSLVILDLSHNNFSGMIPEHLAMGCFSLETLILSNNSLNGPLFPPFSNLTNLQWLYLDNNDFVGEIPHSLFHPDLQVLDISRNHLTGRLPGWVGNMSFLMAVRMFSNHFRGPIPMEFCKLDSLQVMELSENDISGGVPSCLNPPFIKHVHLSQNRLSGPMTRAFLNTSTLVTLDLSDNYLNGTLPSWIGEFPALGVLLLKSNRFSGEIPTGLCKLRQLSILDLSQNELSGTIPRCLHDISFKRNLKSSKVMALQSVIEASISMDSLMGSISNLTTDRDRDEEYDYRYSVQPANVHEEHVEFTTKYALLSFEGKILAYMSGIDLSCNKLTGEIPPMIGNLTKIHALNLSHNALTGSIPTTVTLLKDIESLDLSDNHLSGPIPRLTELNFLSVFSVANNNLSGPTPGQKGQFITFGVSSYVGNPLLCGPPLNNTCDGPVPSPRKSEASDTREVGHDYRRDFVASFLASYVAVLTAIAAVLLVVPRWRLAWFGYIEARILSLL